MEVIYKYMRDEMLLSEENSNDCSEALQVQYGMV